MEKSSNTLLSEKGTLLANPNAPTEALQDEEQINDFFLESSLFTTITTTPTTTATPCSLHAPLMNENKENLTIVNEVSVQEMRSSTSTKIHMDVLENPFNTLAVENGNIQKLLLHGNNHAASRSSLALGNKGETFLLRSGSVEGRKDNGESFSWRGIQGLPSAQVNRLGKAVLPPSMLISKDAKAALQKASTVAVWYIAAMSSVARSEEHAHKKKHRLTLLPGDVINGLELGGWSSILPELSGLLSSSSNSGSGLKRSR